MVLTASVACSPNWLNLSRVHGWVECLSPLGHAGQTVPFLSRALPCSPTFLIGARFCKMAPLERTWLMR